MRWATLAVVFFSLVGSVVSTDSSDEPSLKIMARSSVYNVGEQKGFYCEGTNVGPQDMEWLSPEDKPVERRSSKNNRVYIEKRDPNLLVLIIHSLKIRDNGNWTCKTKEGDVRETIEVIVGEKATVDPDSNKEANEGETVKLDCRTKGIPPPVVQWYKTGVPIEEDRAKYVIRNKSDVYTLEIRRLNHADAGQYLCKVTQKLLTHYVHKIITLVVHHKPINFNRETGDIYILPGRQKERIEETFAVANETKYIECSALAYPQPKFLWFRRTGSFDDPIQDEDKITTSEDLMTSTLRVDVRYEDDVGQYKCEASNEKGKAITIFDVTLGVKPNPPDSISIVGANVSHISFNVSCSNCTFDLPEDEPLNGKNLPVTGYSFQLVRHQDQYEPDWDSSEEFKYIIEDPDDTTFYVGPLANDTTYNVRVRSINMAGYSEWVDLTGELPHTTSSAVRLATVVILIVTMLGLLKGF